MMGLQATTGVAGKRKLEAATALGDSSPAKNGRWEAEDCIARLQAVAVPADTWRSPTPSLASTLLTTDDEFEEDEFEDELSDEEKCVGVPEPAKFTQQPYNSWFFHAVAWVSLPCDLCASVLAHFCTSSRIELFGTLRVSSRSMNEADDRIKRTTGNTTNPHSSKRYVAKRTENPIWNSGLRPQCGRCCDGRTRWCHVPCYRQRRLAVLNLSMCKLARYRQCSDPSLRRSVLICNTLRRLEREMESEPPEPSYSVLPEMPPPCRPSPVPEATYEQSLRDMSCSGRATPFPSTGPDTDSGLGDDEMTRPINWGSVLSLTSQTDLELLNNNELYAELGLSSEQLEWKEPSTSRTDNINEWDGFMHVLVGGS
ncbi:hypothetical protein NQ317_017749 [Molorchus minor]|uniref:SERTA domain-containing protein n=1 Tax=Molorchus minor TaxID=1323400 RepID=A0ABQ9JU74_9CUCU|nr:hypothetical protein NQ317_017749 [Molorchus minor]